MSLTELRASLSAVSDAVPIPAPDLVRLQARVRRARRRRTTGIVAGAAAVVVVVAGGASYEVGRGPQHQVPAQRPAQDGGSPESAPVLPVVLGGRLWTVAADGTIRGPGPEVRGIAGTTEHGVVVVTDSGSVVEVTAAGTVTHLLTEPVHTAYVSGDELVYDTGAAVRWRQVSPDVASADTETMTGRHLLGAGPGGVVLDGPEGVQLRDGSGMHGLEVEPDTESLLQAEAAGGVVALRTDRGDLLYTDHGRHRVALPGDRYGALAPDGSAYARATASRRAVELIDPATGRATPVAGASGRVTGLAWTGPEQLYVVTGSSTLWSCPVGSSCTEVFTEVTPILGLR